MKTIKKNVYYCDFCGKRSLSASAMKKHELHCTANPDRHCRLCDNNSGVRDIVIELKKRFEFEEVMDEFAEFHTEAKWVRNPITLSEIEGLADNCPNCMLAIIRQTGLNRYPFMDDNGINPFHFEYKKLFNQWMQEKRNDEYKYECYL